MEQVFQALIDRSRVRLDLKTVKTILGCKRRPKYRSHKKRAAEWVSRGRETCHDSDDLQAALWRLDSQDL